MEGLSLLEKNLLCIFKGYQDNGKYCFETQKELAEIFGIAERNIRNSLKNLRNKEMIFMKQKSEIDLARQFKNRKAIIMVDADNPFPTNEAPEPVEAPKAITSVVIAPEVETVPIIQEEKKMYTRGQIKLIKYIRNTEIHDMDKDRLIEHVENGDISNFDDAEEYLQHIRY